MSIIAQIKSPSELAQYLNAGVYQSFAPEILVQQQVDLHLACVDDFGQVQARCSLWWTDVPKLENEKLGIIGHYATDNNQSEQDKATEVMLNNACFLLKMQKCTRAIGPMDGNTWRSYRFVTDAGSEPPFFLEPTNPPSWPKYWIDYGFEPLAEYSSGLTTDLTQRDERLPKVEQRLQQKGIYFRHLNINNFEQELRRIYSISVESFSKNYLYTPLDEEDFVTQYMKVKQLVIPELTLIAEKDEQPIGYLFAIPDANEKERGEQVKTVIIKTVAVLPENSHAGLGALLVDKVQQQARVMGFERAIHALMFNGNVSRNISGHYATPMRTYTLFSRSFR